jgi:hypothetical protein
VLGTGSFDVLREHNDLDTVVSEQSALDPSGLEPTIDSYKNEAVVCAPRCHVFILNIALTNSRRRI